jgi:hypothetical protein
MMWSRLSAGRPQYWQAWSSRAKTARRFSEARRSNGTLTKYRRRTTDGSGTSRSAARRTAPVSAITSAFSVSTRTAARRSDTTESGS